MPTRHISIESIDSYVASIQDFSRISTDEELKLSVQIKTGTPEEHQKAKDALICANLRLVIKIAHDFKAFGVNFADLVAEGNLGLITAADKFEPGHGAKFSCYAAWWIKQYMRRAIAWQSRVIRIPGGSAQRLIHISKARSRYIAEYAEEPTAETLSKLTGYPIVTIRMLERAATDTLSLNAFVNDESETTFETMFAETEEDTSSDQSVRVDKVREAMSSLSQLESHIVTRTFGLETNPVDIKIIAQETGMSVASVHARLTDILAKMKTLIGTSSFLSPALT